MYAFHFILIFETRKVKVGEKLNHSTWLGHVLLWSPLKMPKGLLTSLQLCPKQVPVHTCQIWSVSLWSRETTKSIFTGLCLTRNTHSCIQQRALYLWTQMQDNGYLWKIYSCQHWPAGLGRVCLPHPASMWHWLSSWTDWQGQYLISYLWFTNSKLPQNIHTGCVFYWKGIPQIFTPLTSYHFFSV